MNTTGIILVIVALFLVFKISTMDHEQTGGDLKQMTIDNRYQDPYYARQYRELDDVDNVLNRPQEPGKPHIENLKPVHTVGLGSQKKIQNNDTANPKTVISDTTRVLVEGQQPYFLDEALIIDRDGYKYYWDWRYPKEPVSIDFLKDPDTFIKKHPNVYPSYVIRSRNLTGLQPHDLQSSTQAIYQSN